MNSRPFDRRAAWANAPPMPARTTANTWVMWFSPAPRNKRTICTLLQLRSASVVYRQGNDTCPLHSYNGDLCRQTSQADCLEDVPCLVIATFSASQFWRCLLPEHGRHTKNVPILAKSKRSAFFHRQYVRSP